MGRIREVEIDRNITVEIDIESGQIERCMIDGIDYMNGTVEELLLAALGGAYKYQQMICRFLDDAKENYHD